MRILVVEDEIGIAIFLKQGLEEESFVVDVAYEGDKGLVMALSGKYDILILDWMLPEKSGVEICIEFRKKFKKTPVIFLTAKDTVKETIFGLQVGANDYIKKPFHFEELLERIRVQLRPKTEELVGELTLGPIKLNINTHQVTKNNIDIPLTQKNFFYLKC